MLRGVAWTTSRPIALAYAGETELVAATVKEYVASSMPVQSAGTAIVMVLVAGPHAGAVISSGASVTQLDGMAVGTARYAPPKSRLVKESAIVSATLPPFTRSTAYVAVPPGWTPARTGDRATRGSPNGSTSRVASRSDATEGSDTLWAAIVRECGPGVVVHARTGVTRTS